MYCSIWEKEGGLIRFTMTKLRLTKKTPVTSSVKYASILQLRMGKPTTQQRQAIQLQVCESRFCMSDEKLVVEKKRKKNQNF